MTARLISRKLESEGGPSMAALDRVRMLGVESVPGKVSGAWVFKGTRTPVAVVNIRHQQNLTNRRIAIVVLGKARWRLIKLRLQEIAPSLPQRLQVASPKLRSLRPK